MIIKSLKLENYRRFEQLDIDFPENLIGIIGRNGAGKSTLIEAIGWTLYGNRFSRSDKLDVRSQHADDKTVCSAEMVFVYGGSEFRIERKLKGKNALSEAAVWRDGGEEPVAVQDRGVNEFIEELLQLDYRSFTTSVFAQQKELAKLSTLQPEQRRQAINRLINIDLIDRARENVRRDRNEKKAFVSGKKCTLKDVDDLKTRQKQLKDESIEKEQEKTRLTSQLDQAEKKLHTVRDQLETVTKLRDQFRSWDGQIATLRSRQQDCEKNISRSTEELREIEQAEKELEDLSALLKEFDAVKAEKERLDEEREKFTHLQSREKEKQLVEASLNREVANKNEAAQKSAELEQLRRALETITSEMNDLEKQINAIQEKKEKALAQRETAESKGKDLKAKLAGIEKLGPDGECPVCTQRMGDHFGAVVEDHHKQLAELRSSYSTFKKAEEDAAAELKEVQKSLAQKRTDREELLKKLKSAQDAQERVDKIQEHISNFEKQIKLIKAAIAEIGPVDYDEDRHKRFKAKFEELAAIQQKAAKLEERVGRRSVVETFLKSSHKELEQIVSDMQSAQSAQAALAFQEDDYVTAKQKVDDATAEFNLVKDQLSAASQQLAVLLRDIENVKKDITEQKQLAKEIEETENDIVYLNALDEYFGQFRLELAGRIRPLIAQRASELLSLTTTSRYSHIDLDQDYNIHIFDGNIAFPIERFSGGEQDLANLCLRISISQVVAERSGGAPINFIVLDEIFGSQDSERRDLILNALGQLSSQFRQIFIITHIETVKDMLPVLLNVRAKDDVTSVVEMV